jgi:CheY-like chemotaxis protein
MDLNTVLLIEPDKRARDLVRDALEQLFRRVVSTRSLGEATGALRDAAHDRHPTVFICDYDEMIRGSYLRGSATRLAETMDVDIVALDPTFDIEQLPFREALQRMEVGMTFLRNLSGVESGERESRSAASPMVIVTSDEPTAVQHEVALQAGAAMFLPEADAARVGVLRHYVGNWLRHHGGEALLLVDDAEAGQPNPDSLASAFRLSAPDLRSSGVLDIKKIASYLSVEQQQLARAIGVGAKAASARPALAARDSVLRPFEEIIAIVRDIYHGDDDRVRAWLRTRRPELSENTPLDVMLEPERVEVVRSLVEGGWVGDVD